MLTIKLGKAPPPRAREITMTYAGEHLITQVAVGDGCDYIFKGFLNTGRFQVGVVSNTGDIGQKKCIENVGSSNVKDLVFILREEDITEFKIVRVPAYVECIDYLIDIEGVSMCFITFKIKECFAKGVF